MCVCGPWLMHCKGKSIRSIQIISISNLCEKRILWILLHKLSPNKAVVVKFSKFSNRSFPTLCIKQDWFSGGMGLWVKIGYRTPKMDGLPEKVCQRVQSLDPTPINKHICTSAAWFRCLQQTRVPQTPSPVHFHPFLKKWRLLTWETSNELSVDLYRVYMSKENGWDNNKLIYITIVVPWHFGPIPNWEIGFFLQFGTECSPRFCAKGTNRGCRIATSQVLPCPATLLIAQGSQLTQRPWQGVIRFLLPIGPWFCFALVRPRFFHQRGRRALQIQRDALECPCFLGKKLRINSTLGVERKTTVTSKLGRTSGIPTVTSSRHFTADGNPLWSWQTTPVCEKRGPEIHAFQTLSLFKLKTVLGKMVKTLTWPSPTNEEWLL